MLSQYQPVSETFSAQFPHPQTHVEALSTVLSELDVPLFNAVSGQWSVQDSTDKTNFLGDVEGTVTVFLDSIVDRVMSNITNEDVEEGGGKSGQSSPTFSRNQRMVPSVDQRSVGYLEPLPAEDTIIEIPEDLPPCVIQTPLPSSSLLLPFLAASSETPSSSTNTVDEDPPDIFPTSSNDHLSTIDEGGEFPESNTSGTIIPSLLTVKHPSFATLTEAKITPVTSAQSQPHINYYNFDIPQPQRTGYMKMSATDVVKKPSQTSAAIFFNQNKKRFTRVDETVQEYRKTTDNDEESISVPKKFRIDEEPFVFLEKKKRLSLKISKKKLKNRLSMRKKREKLKEKQNEDYLSEAYAYGDRASVCKRLFRKNKGSSLSITFIQFT